MIVSKSSQISLWLAIVNDFENLHDDADNPNKNNQNRCYM
jgi:hypothetical protein